MATNPLFEWPALASQLQELGQRPQWPHAAERKQLMVRYTGTLQAFALAVPVHIREDWSSFKVAWDQRPKEIEPHPLASNAKPQAMPVSGASLSASHYWVLFWVRAVRTPGTTFGRDHLSGNVSTFSRVFRQH